MLIIPALLTTFAIIMFINEETIGCIGAINEAALGDIIAPRNPPSCFSISCLLVSVAPPINRPECSSNFTILTSSRSPFEMDKVNSYTAVTAPGALIFLSNVSNIDEVALVTNIGKTCLVKEQQGLLVLF